MMNVLIWLSLLQCGCSAFQLSSTQPFSRVSGVNHAFHERLPVKPFLHWKRSRPSAVPLSPLFQTANDNQDGARNQDSMTSKMTDTVNPVLQEASRLLKQTSWFSWWAQTILTVISTTILLFAANANTAKAANTPYPSFFLSSLGLAVSFMSIVWTWGNGTRLSRRLLKNTKGGSAATSSSSSSNNNKEEPKKKGKLSFLPATPASLLRRAIKVQVSLNLVGLFLTLLAAEEIVGSLALKVLTQGNFLAGGMAATPSGWVQPLDILIVQANTNTLLSHFASLTSSLYLADRVRLTQPPDEALPQSS